MLYSAEHEFSNTHKSKMVKNTLLALKLSVAVFILLINVKLLTIVDTLALMRRINFMFS